MLNYSRHTILGIRTWNHCLLMCAHARICKGFNYHEVSSRCELFETVNCTKLDSLAGWRFGRIKTDQTETQTYTNIALNKPTYQSTTSRVSGKAVDGNRNGNLQLYNSCSHTLTNTIVEPWWIVDLGKSYNLFQIVIWNRLDCCGHRLHDFAIEVNCEFDGSNSDSPSWSRAYLHDGTPSSNPTIISFPESSIGRFVKIKNAVVKSADPNNDVLALCEVEVYVKQENCDCELGKLNS
ncbi:unnamed protein product [Owenia fusiformis]|uniref:Uncharacterized protein n=1 Tax=Owenia fusiformis TaxID=6347 RepID=A0A8J1UWL8_OWEFU|nr:unnamed protein product [Owenia fusiformis]